MAGQRDESLSQEQRLRQASHAMDDMLRQLQNATTDATRGGSGRSFGRGRGRSFGTGRGSFSRDRSPRDGSDFFRGSSKMSRPRGRGPNWRGAWRGHWEPPGRTWLQQGSHFSGWENQPHHNPGYGGAGHVTPHLLVKHLASFPTFSTSLLQLMEDMGLVPSSVREVTSTFPQLFHLNGEIVELKPQVNICTANAGPQGCLRLSSCEDLHICPDYVLSWCHNNSCAQGHKWHTNHNLAVLKLFCLDDLRVGTLRKLVQSLSKLSNPRQLEVCHKYNEGGCNQTDCDALHMCLSYITGLARCSLDDCQLNHDLLSDDCYQLLKTHGLPTNEAPRDIVLSLLSADPTLAQAVQSSDKRNRDSSQKKLSRHQTHEKDARKILKIERLSDSYKENETKKIIGTTRKGNLKKGKYVSSESESQSSSRSESESDVESSLSLKTKGGSDSESSSLSKTKSVKKTSITKKRVKPKEGKHSNTDDIYSDQSDSNTDDIYSDQSDSNTDDIYSDQSDLGSTPSSEIEESQSVTDSKTKITKKDEVPGSPDQSTPTPVKQEKRQTLWSQDLQGDVPVLEICYYSVESMCKNERSGCQRLHCTQHFHWQFSEQGNRWYNLRLDQVTCLERSFCDPSQDGVALPRLDPATLEISVRGLLILMGRDSWYADFKIMNLTNSLKTKTLQIRRLCTETISGQVIQPANFKWYFLDKNQKWVGYGNVDTAGETTLVSSVTSDDIENHFKQNPSVSMSFQNSKFTYILDFNSMMQTNQKTNVSREVRRRPWSHLPDEKEKSDQKTSKDLPSEWEIMQPEERMRLVDLVPSSSEYQTVVGLMQQRGSISSVIKVQRIQNPYLWRAMQNKIKEMTVIYNGDASKVNIQQLFHGTTADVVPKICTENFDGRLYGIRSGNAHGQGAYFSTDAAYSYSYCQADSGNMKYLFVSRVAVGTTTPGDSSMKRPPLNPATNTLFDSTTNGGSNPNIIVKYDKQEYYPEYLLTLT